jgi:hypothetical protein
MHTQLHALSAFRGPLAGAGILLFVILLTFLLILMIYAVMRAPAWQPTLRPDGAGPGPGGRPAPLPHRRAPGPASSVFQPALPARQPARPAAARTPAGSTPAARTAAAAVAPVPHPAGAGAPPARGLATSPAEPDPPVLERPVVTGRPPWGPAPRPPGLI